MTYTMRNIKLFSLGSEIPQMGTNRRHQRMSKKVLETDSSCSSYETQEIEIVRNPIHAFPGLPPRYSIADAKMTREGVLAGTVLRE